MKKLVVLAVAVLFGAPATALAVWGGSEDLAHPGVGAMYFDFDENGTITSDDFLCSGSYAGRSKDGRDVFLTAGHCIPPPDSASRRASCGSRSTATAGTASAARSPPSRTTRCPASATTPGTSGTSASC